MASYTCRMYTFFKTTEIRRQILYFKPVVDVITYYLLLLLLFNYLLDNVQWKNISIDYNIYEAY